MSRGRRYQERQRNKGLCIYCGVGELYSTWYCHKCWKKILKKQEEYRRSKGIIPRSQYLINIKRKTHKPTLKEIQIKYNRIKKTRCSNSQYLKPCIDFLFESEKK